MLDTSKSINHHLSFALGAIAVFGGGSLVWSLSAPMASAVVAPGTVMVEGSVKKIQHQAGGIVGKLNVSEGQEVNAGDVLIRLDDTEARANLAIVVNSLVSLEAQLTRLRAERDGSDLQFPEDLLQQVGLDPTVSLSLDGERRAFSARAYAREGKKKQLSEQISQLEKEIEGLTAQAGAASEQYEIAKQELRDLEPLDKNGLTPRQRITSLQKEVSRSKGAIADLQSKIAEANGKIAEIRLQILQLDSDVSTEAATGIRDIETKIGELKEKRVAAEDFLNHIDLKAPITGRVQQLAVHTIGGVIAPAEQIMLIVPDTAQLIVEAQISPLDIDQVSVGQETLLRFLAFNQRTTPELTGRVARVAGDAAKDQQTNQPYFTVGIEVPADQLAKLGKFKLVPGMPAEAYIKTGERTFASYILKPFTDQMQRAMRED